MTYSRKPRPFTWMNVKSFPYQKKITTVRITDSEIAEIKQNQEESVAVRVIHEKKIMSARSIQAKQKNFWKKF